jgi:glucose-1-phosphate thymidylyltransferase
LDKLFEVPISKVVIVSNNKFFNDFSKWKETSPYSKRIFLINDGTNAPEEALGWERDLALAFPQINEDFLVLASDTLFGFKMNDFVSKFSKEPLLAVCDVHSLESAKKYGVVELDGDKIISFEEKPMYPKSTLKACLFYYFPLSIKQDVISMLSGGKKEHLIAYLKSKKFQLNAFFFSEYMHDIGDLATYNELKDKN